MTSKNMGICPQVRQSRHRFRITAVSLLVVAFAIGAKESALAQPLPTIEAATDGLVKQEGFVNTYWNDDEGRLLIEIDEEGGLFLYHTALAGGLGSNDVGLDRGLLGSTKLVRFRRVGKRVLLFEENTKFRATADNEYERLAVSDAFAPSVVHGFDIVGRTGSRLVVDATSFVVRDEMGIAKQLKDAGQGDFSLDADRSAVNTTVVRSFPANTELEAWLTFASENPGRFVSQAAADARSVTLRIRHSLIALPDDQYMPRRFDPRAGYYGITFLDYSTPVSAEKERRFIARHRLSLVDGRVAEPIVYYLDRGVPEPIRAALLDGARWWSQAFEAAGLPGAFRVEMLPAGADALDVRYNVIQWVHRATRGWSWGDAVIDPRTGEILKGYVALGSLRVRQDYLLAQGLLGTTKPDALGEDPMLAPALARIRQLSAHEVGHTLGLVHNYAASVSDRASVMDYPAPLVRVDEEGGFNHDQAYAVGIGEWDKYAIRYGYTVFLSPEEEEAGLNEIIRSRRDAGLRFITDRDARPAGGAHPAAHLWDNGSDVLEALEQEMTLRRAGLEQFSAERLPEGMPLAVLEDVLVPLYLRHRYQIEAAVKLIGGVWYEYQIVGEPSDPLHPVDGDVQRDALALLLRAVDPSELQIPEQVRNILPPRPLGYPETRELFPGNTGLTFDAFSPAASIADFVFGLLLDPDRATRLAYQHIEDPTRPGLDELLSTARDSVFTISDEATSYDRALRRIVQERWIRSLVRLAQGAEATEVAAIVHGELASMSAWLSEGNGYDSREDAHRRRLAADVDRYLLRPFNESEEPKPVEMPPGSPIGSDR